MATTLWDGRYEGRTYFFVDDEPRADTTPPAAVTNLSATLGGTSLTLNWTPPATAAYYLFVWADRPLEECTSNCSTDPQATDVVNYRNWWAAQPAACAATTCTGSFTIPNVTCAPCRAAVFAFDGANNMSAMSNVALSTSGPPVPPPAPQGFRLN